MTTPLGAWPSPISLDAYRARPPFGHSGLYIRPLLSLWGTVEPAVARTQAETIVEELTRHVVPHAYLPFTGESPGIHRTDTRIACLAAEFSSCGQKLDFVPPDTPTLPLVTADDIGGSAMA